MIAVLTLTLPIWLMVLIGFVAVRTGYLEGAQVAALGQFTLKVALIALIVQAVAVPRAGAALSVPFLLAYGAAGVATMLAGFALVRWVLRRPSPESWVLAMGMGNSNSGFLGLPIATLVFGEAGARVFAMTMVVENVLTLPFAMVAAGAAMGQGARLGALVADAARRVARNPLIVAVVLSLGLRLGEVPLPEPVLRAVSALAAAALPVALFVIGGTLARLGPGGHAPQVLAVALGKLVLHPGLALVALMLVPGVPADLVPVGVMFAGVSMLTIYPLLAAPYGAMPVAATAMIVTTAVSVLSVPVLLTMLGVAGP